MINAVLLGLLIFFIVKHVELSQDPDNNRFYLSEFNVFYDRNNNPPRLDLS